MMTSCSVGRSFSPILLAGFATWLLISCSGDDGSDEGSGASGGADAGAVGGSAGATGGAAGSTGGSAGSTGGSAGSTGGSGGIGVPCSNLLVEDVASASTIPSAGGPVPAAGEPFTISQTGMLVTRISDIDDLGASADSYTNGYSRWSPANLSGTHVIAFGNNGQADVYDLVSRQIVYHLDVGEPNELHWDASGVSGTEQTLFYRDGAELHRVDIQADSDTLVHDFTSEYPSAGAVLNGVEGAPSNNMQYWAFQVCEGMTGGGQCTGIIDVIVYDMNSDAIVGRLSDHANSIPTPNFVDMSPSGSKILVGTCAGNPAPFNGMYVWSRDFGTYMRVNTNCAHSGWAWGMGGEELLVAPDPCGANNDEPTFSCDYIMTVDVNDSAGWENRTPVLYSGDLGWGNGVHIGRIYDSSVRGWFFLSTYSSGAAAWGTNQLMFVETQADPRLWRVSPTLNAYEGYWSEAFASLDFQALHVYWGANWGGQNNLELYQARLCDSWWDSLNSL